MDKELERVKRNGMTSSLLLLDVDNFKQINDSHGHATGDDVLVTLATTLRQMLRPNDAVGRLGGEEFVILVPDGNCTQAMRLGERICLAIKDTPITNSKGENLQITASIGIGEFRPESESVKAVLAIADGHLYHAKATGRNRVVSEY